MSDFRYAYVYYNSNFIKLRAMHILRYPLQDVSKVSLRLGDWIQLTLASNIGYLISLFPFSTFVDTLSDNLSFFGFREPTCGIVGGAGGGCIFVPMLTIIIDFDAKSATAIYAEKTKYIKYQNISTEMDPDDNIQSFDIDPSNPFVASGSNDKQREKIQQQKFYL
ncbi:hypothetical protein L1987_01406 [Smallanthus sonchifolius]|uniref:Uncharacterized protein n=1 Tax=Smallanthus sonchifolius TaxID=185202 RepID=A0ACB9K513_9ASTR|nr:hypothetical protein L1987_01406 [Smallanthus sonchifolius]